MKTLCLLLIPAALLAQCVTLTFTYPAGLLTNVTFTVERSTNVVFTNTEEMVTIVTSDCATNARAFYRVRANAK